MDVHSFGDALARAVEAGDGGLIRAFYAPDAVVWYNTTGKEHPIEEVIGNLVGLKAVVPDQQLKVVSRVLTENGYVQQDLATGTLLNGHDFALRTCAVVTMANGVIIRVEEYLDSNDLKALFEMVGNGAHE